MATLDQMDITYLRGVGPARAQLLEKQLGISTFDDLLHYFPFRHIDRSTVHTISQLQGDMPYVQLRGRFVTMSMHGEGAKRRLQALFSDGTGTIEVVWFNRAKSIAQTYKTGVEYTLFGKPTLYKNHYNMVHPEVDVVTQGEQPRGLQGIYSLTEGLTKRGVTQRVIQRLVGELLATPAAQHVPETLPAEILARYKMLPLTEALHAMHTPPDIETLQRAQFRFKYEELFYLQMHIQRHALKRKAQQRGNVFAVVGDKFNDFYRRGLEFPLTEAQKRVIREIRHDMGSGRQMNRLLQGDVGSGKTIVAFLCMLLAVDNGYQACIMAPTEILATQHYQSIAQMASVVGVNVALLTGSTRKKQRDAIHQGLADGSLNILIGTHALIEDTVQFARLGLAVIDEQHRFGVAQRAKLWAKGQVPPHVLVMTATPIPRTLAMTVYGDLDVSIIDELPPGRKPVQTVMRYDTNRLEVYRFVHSEIVKGRQVYIVYPLIEENEKLDLLALEQGYEMVREAFPDVSVSYVHGRMKPAEKDHQMELFASNKTKILVATTVIEVGVNVPNASVMVIENAERFGLSQLHQLRGRVGRGADRSYCILMTKHQIAGDTRHRLEVMTQTTDGFLIAEEDMRLRGPGDMEGTQQSGIALNLRVANLARDGQIVQLTRDDARDFLEHDPELTTAAGHLIDAQLHRLFDRTQDWGRIS